MSLHLIESTTAPKSSTKKRGGATASVIVHAVLVVGAFTAASAAPVLDEPRLVDDITYVAPKPAPMPKPLPKARTSTEQSNCDCILAIPMPIEIPIEIPIVIPQADYLMEIGSERDFSRRPKGTGNGTGGEGTSQNGVTGTLDVMSELQVDRQVAVLSGYRTPRYPEGMRSAGIEETLNATFVVDTLGRIEPGSLEVPNAQHTQFIVAVRQALADAKFRPAEAHGKRVRQRVVQSFVFSLQRD